ncbi:hypothetical protein BGLA2_1230021 [Burkholderia gladioli]|nr:hypothetical protein BGLA2_1230021 [Burkholderia gladioli]
MADLGWTSALPHGMHRGGPPALRYGCRRHEIRSVGCVPIKDYGNDLIFVLIRPCRPEDQTFQMERGRVIAETVRCRAR